MTSRSVPLFPNSKGFAKGDLIGGRYRLVRQIGAGAMGTVWVAHNQLLDVEVAIKVLRVDNQKADATRLYKRLLREAQTAARLGHPGIVRIFDFGQTPDKSPYIVMELLAGESLAELLARDPKMDAVQAVQLLLPVIDAMATAHGRGIIHRDIKPENIFLARDEYGRLRPKVVDFGVARFAEAGRSLTRSGALLGTPDYMAPEQARGEPNIDQRVDIWALCIVLYELVTGRRPFARDATNYLAVLRAIVHEPAPPIAGFGISDAGLWRIIERGLKKRKTDRWETMHSLGEALALWLYERGVREDAVGASLKATWLQSGLDGVKIDTPSMFPPKAPESDPPDTAVPGAPSDVPPPPSSGRSKLAPPPVPVFDEAPHSESQPAPILPPLAAATPSTPAPTNGRFSAIALAVAIAALSVTTLVVVLKGTTKHPDTSDLDVAAAHMEPAATPVAPDAPREPVAGETPYDPVAAEEPREPVNANAVAPAPAPAEAVPAARGAAAEPPPTRDPEVAPSARAPAPHASARTASTATPARATYHPTRAPAKRPAQKGQLPSAKTFDFGF